MIIGDILAVSGILLTIVFGVYSIWAYRKTKRRISLEFLNEQCYNLFREEVNNLNIEILYKDKSINNPIILFKSRLLNSGTEDIDKSKIFKPLKITITKEFKWLEANIINQPIGCVSSILIVNDNTLKIDWDLLKQDEYIDIEAIVEIIEKDKVEGLKTLAFFNSITFDYRITDLKEINKNGGLKITNRLIRLKTISYVLSIFISICGVLILSSNYIAPLKRHFVPLEPLYTIESSGKLYKCFVDKTDDGLLLISDKTNMNETKLTVKNFNDNYKIIDVSCLKERGDRNYLTKYVGILYLCGGIFLLMFFNFYISKHIKSIQKYFPITK